MNRIPYEVFKCDVPNMSTSLYFVVNDTFYKEGRTETAAEHKPDYLRVSQAERERAQRLKKESEGEKA